ncbi:MAG: hypothetical protein ACTSRS_19295 [Candidatus Helarchaeota archaeon]
MPSSNRHQMYQFFFSDPKERPFFKTINGVTVQYYYFTDPIDIKTASQEVCNFCLLKGTSTLHYKNEEFTLTQFDFIYLPPNEGITLIPSTHHLLANKICIVTSPLLANYESAKVSSFEIQHFTWDKFVPRGEFSDSHKMATYREVWTAFKNGFFMSGFTNIPQDAMAQGVVTSVNLEQEGGRIQILPHVHPGYPEVYIYCIDDTTESMAVTQFLINSKGQSVSRDLTDGEGIFFDGSLGHLNFTKPTYRTFKYCLYLWIIPTFGKVRAVTPIPLKFKN